MGFFNKSKGFLDKTINNCRQYRLIFIIATLMFSVFFLTRFSLLLYSFSSYEFSLGTFIASFCIGLLYDFAFILYAMAPLILSTTFIPTKFVNKKFFDYSRFLVLFGSSFAIFFVYVAEILFWDEFQVRFNFISVDYLIYRQEVTDNIQQSYPLWLILSVISILSLGLVYLLKDKIKANVENMFSLKNRLIIFAAYVILFFITILSIDQSPRENFSNSYQSELASNGPYQFVAAFRNNELPFKQFYTSISDTESAKIIKRELSISDENESSFDIYRSQKFPRLRRKMNIFLIMVESLSSDYMKYFGNSDGITPHLDQLVNSSVFFDKMYATGTRTTRGLEAVTLSIPPTPGRSIVKRLGRETGFCSLGNILNENDYNVNFIYGGRGYFDNMNAFFSGNGYGIIDQASTPSEEIMFSNAWGMSDEDLFSQALKVADDSHKKGKLFFSHVMTTSNHRPFTYPDNRIDIPSGTGRNGAVKYSDWAINDLLEKASKKPWFKDTLFVIISDHQANSAGKLDLPLERYHIPMWFYSPSNLKPKIINKVCSQIDLAPTILAWLGIDYSAPFFGKDIFTMKSKDERALVGTYQHLGLFQNHNMAILSPQKKLQIHIDADSKKPKVISTDINNELVKLCISYYQSASEIYKNGLNAWSRRPSPKKVTKK